MNAHVYKKTRCCIEIILFTKLECLRNLNTVNFFINSIFFFTRTGYEKQKAKENKKMYRK